MNEKLLSYFNGDDFAADVWYRKYRATGEITPDEMHRREAREFARIEANYYEKEYMDVCHPEFQTKHDFLSPYGQRRDWLDEDSIYNLFKDFKYIIPQGRVMAGLGVLESYRSLSNCLRLPPPKDSYSSIMYTDTMLVSSAKRGCGYGVGLSNLRPEDVFVSNAAQTSTGAASFMERYSNSTREVAQKGRRGACLLDMEIFHPDVLQFIKAKKNLTKVTGANISVKLYNEFMEAVENDDDFILRWPCNISIETIEELDDEPYNELRTIFPGQYIKKIKAKEYWDEIINSAHSNAEPGLFFFDRVINYDPSSVYKKYQIDGTNACGEQPMAVYDTCRLILLNLYSFVKNPFTPEATVDFQLLYEMAYEQLRLGDNLVDLEIEYIDRIIGKIECDSLPHKEKAIELELWVNVRDMAVSGRRVGCGITALADMLAALGIKYDSDEGLEMIELVMGTKMAAELDAGKDLAILRGKFEGWEKVKEYGFKMDSYGKPSYGKNDFYQFLLEEYPKEVEDMCIHGRRNVNWSTIAPAGSSSIMAKTDKFFNLSSGCEPQFLPFHMRKTKVNASDPSIRVDYVDDKGDSWMEYPITMGAFKEWLVAQIEDSFSLEEKENMIFSMSEEQMNDWFKVSPWFGCTANEIDWKQRIKVQSMLQRYTTSAISSTLNLPKDVSKKTVSDIYFAAWKHGLKGVTIYREGSRKGVLTAESSNVSFEEKDAVKRIPELKALTFKSTSKGEHYHVLIGLLEDKPYEIFIDNSNNKYSSEGRIVKEGSGEYVFKNGGDPVMIKDFMSPEQQAITRLVSMGLRHRIAIKYIVEQLGKIDGDMFSFAKSLARVLKRFIPNGEQASVKCLNPDCPGDGTNVIYEEGCHKCLDCGDSKCG